MHITVKITLVNSIGRKHVYVKLYKNFEDFNFQFLVLLIVNKSGIIPLLFRVHRRSFEGVYG